MPQLTEAQRGMIATIREFVRREVQPVAQDMEHADEYPFELVERMKELGLFGAVIPEEYGGLELDVASYALVIEEICRGWMSLSGILNSHLIMAYMVSTHGTPEQKERFLPLMATGEKRGGICITEPNAGSDVQAIETRATRDGDDYVVNGSKSLITNGRHGNTFALVTKTDPEADPPRRGISIFIAEKGPGFNVVRDIPKLGYKGVDTCELSFDDYRVSGGNMVGGRGRQGLLPDNERAGVGPHQRRRPLLGRGPRGAGRVHPLCQATPNLRQAHRRASERPDNAGQYGDQHPGGAPDGAARRRQEG